MVSIMTKRFDLYGSQSLPLSELAHRVEVALGLPVQLRDSFYRGGDYYRGTGDGGRRADPSNELRRPRRTDFPDHTVLVYVTGADETMTEQLRRVPDLGLLRTETW